MGMQKSLELFSSPEPGQPQKPSPLADRMRPRTLDEFVGQNHLVGPGRLLRRAIETDELHSIIFWGPPGSGKTTLAYVIAQATHSHFIPFSAVTATIKEIREVIKEARAERLRGRRTILFIDEIHRFNKAQQDAFLPHVEKGTIILIGATTENPSFEVIGPLLSRTRVFVLNPLTEGEVRTILERAIQDNERGLGPFKVRVEPEAIAHMIRIANGDARVALNILELAAMTTPPDREGCRLITLTIAEDAAQRRSLLYDKDGEEHYNLISALHKSLRGSDPDASLYWLARMLHAGEDPFYIARRLIRFASEDVGNADPQALSVAVAAKEAYHFLGSPEGELALAQCVVYLATAPKSNSVYTAFLDAARDVEEAPALPPPLHIRNAPTPLMKELGYGKGYKYAHEFPDAYVEQEYFPEGLKGRAYYKPSERGFEAEIRKRLEKWRKGKAED